MIIPAVMPINSGSSGHRSLIRHFLLPAGLPPIRSALNTRTLNHKLDARAFKSAMLLSVLKVWDPVERLRWREPFNGVRVDSLPRLVSSLCQLNCRA